MADFASYRVTEVKDNGRKGRTWEAADGDEAREIEQRERRLLPRGSSNHFKVTEVH